jgi:methylase of polypeptide subunit release factors
LKTDLPYEWPVIRMGVLVMIMRVLANLVTLGLAARRDQRSFERSGDISVWPFLRRTDYEAALANPPYLNGPPSHSSLPTAYGRG